MNALVVRQSIHKVHYKSLKILNAGNLWQNPREWHVRLFTLWRNQSTSHLSNVWFYYRFCWRIIRSLFPRFRYNTNCILLFYHYALNVCIAKMEDRKQHKQNDNMKYFCFNLLKLPVFQPFKHADWTSKNSSELPFLVVTKTVLINAF